MRTAGNFLIPNQPGERAYYDTVDKQKNRYIITLDEFNKGSIDILDIPLNEVTEENIRAVLQKHNLPFRPLSLNNL